MKAVSRRRALPVYIAAAVFALYALLFPLYALPHFLLAAVVTAAAWLIADRVIKPETVYEPEPVEEEPDPVSYGPETDAILAEAKTAREEMERLALSIGDSSVSAKITVLTALSDKIAQDAIADPNDIPKIRKFQGYFLPSTIALLHAYDRMSDSSGDTAVFTRERISRMLDTEITAFEKQLDSLYDNDAFDVESDIRVMEKLLEREGLLEEDELHKILRSKNESGTNNES